MTGSSPLTRGKPSGTFPRPTSSGLIPAHAGKTGKRAGLRALLRAHPRSRGENGETSRPSRAAAGSSPLTRGKQRKQTGQARVPGLIPAHAGKTQSSSAWSGRAWAHPRSRGENLDALEPVASGLGSSPLTRGKQRRTACDTNNWWLIPAHAGKTETVPLVTIRHRAHPRSRGENSRSMWPCIASSGSSPLTRGKLIS